MEVTLRSAKPWLPVRATLTGEAENSVHWARREGEGFEEEDVLQPSTGRRGRSSSLPSVCCQKQRDITLRRRASQKQEEQDLEALRHCGKPVHQSRLYDTLPPCSPRIRMATYKDMKRVWLQSSRPLTPVSILI